MAYIFDNKDTVIEYLRQLEFTVGEEYNHYVVPHHSYTTRFDIFYNSENVGYVENEYLTDNSSNNWVIHIPTEKRAYLEAKQKGLYAAIFDLPNESDGDIDKKYYIEPKAFTRIITKRYDNSAIQVDANGPGAFVGLKFNNDFVNLEKTEVSLGSTQVNITIDLKKFAQALKYTFTEIAGALPRGVVTEPQGISVKNCHVYPSMIVATDGNSRPDWVSNEEITVGKAGSAANADMLGFKRPEEYVTYANISSDIASYFENSYEYGFRTLYDMNSGKYSVYTRAYKVHLLGDVSGEAEVTNFNDIDIYCKIANKGMDDEDTPPEKYEWRSTDSVKFSTRTFTINNMDIVEEDGNVIFNIPENGNYIFRVNQETVLSMVEGSGNDIAELFDSDPNYEYKDGDLVGIGVDGLVRPFSEGDVEYIGVVSLTPSTILGGTLEKGSKIPVAIAGRKSCWVKGTKVVPGRRIIADEEFGMFRVCDKLFDTEYNGIVIKVQEVTDTDSLCYILLK